MRDHQDRSPSRRRGRLLRWTGSLLVVSGAAMLAWCVAIVVDTSRSQEAARLALDRAPRSDVPASVREPSPTAPARPRVPLVAGAAIAELLIPRVDLSSMVLEGADARTLRRGPGHLETTPLPGESGNVVIAGHRDTFFRPLRDVRVGDDIFVNTPQQNVHYQVASLRVVNAHDLTVLNATDEDALTLITCFPFWVLGPAPDRFVVRAIRVGETGSAPVATSTFTPPVSLPAPVIQHAVSAPPPRARPAAADDEALVRRAIERFRAVYNGRLIRHNEGGNASPLTFSTCDVTVTGDQATATCETTRETDRQLQVWTMSLQRSEGDWAIKAMTN
jgi:sortase A